jgi:hypothetical protein
MSEIFNRTVRVVILGPLALISLLGTLAEVASDWLDERLK